VAAVLFAGCGGVETEDVTPVERSPMEIVQSTLQTIAETGEVGSEAGEMMNQIDALKASNPDAAAVLESDGPALMGITDPTAAKAKANEMLGKLGGG
jgi:hypothetical protein